MGRRWNVNSLAGTIRNTTRSVVRSHHQFFYTILPPIDVTSPRVTTPGEKKSKPQVKHAIYDRVSLDNTALQETTLGDKKKHNPTKVPSGVASEDTVLIDEATQLWWQVSWVQKRANPQRLLEPPEWSKSSFSIFPPKRGRNAIYNSVLDLRNNDFTPLLAWHDEISSINNFS